MWTRKHYVKVLGYIKVWHLSFEFLQEIEANDKNNVFFFSSKDFRQINVSHLLFKFLRQLDATANDNALSEDSDVH